MLLQLSFFVFLTKESTYGFVTWLPNGFVTCLSNGFAVCDSVGSLFYLQA